MDDEKLKNLDKKFVRYYKWVDKNKNLLLNPEELEMFTYHWVRFAVSLGLLDEYYGNKEIQVLELGGFEASTKLISKYFPNWKITNYSDDLRKPNWDLKENYFDLILNMEVIEHLTDQYIEKTENPEYCYDYNGKFIYSGAINCLLESNRVLKKEGRMFLSTPNVLSYLNIHNMLLGEAPYQWVNHIREYSLKELKNLFKRTGFKIKNYECVEVLCADWDFSYIDKIFESTNSEKKNRWSNFFFDLGVKEKNVEPLKQVSAIEEKELLISQKELQITEINERYEALLSKYNQISNSLSWRLLKPFRSLIKLILRR